METRRLKNIAILILLLLNLFLLLLLGVQHLQSRQAQADSARQLEQLFAASELSLSRQVDLTQEPLALLTLSRDAEMESAIAASLLGAGAEAVSEGGGIYSYTTEYGAMQFRAGGSFDSSRLALPVADAEQFCLAFFTQFGYGDITFQKDGSHFTVSATQQIEDVPIAGCTVTLLFEDGVLTSAAGSHVSLENAVTEQENLLSCVTALVRFLDHRRTSGIICRQVEAVACVYELQSSPSARQLTPVWQVETDTYTYFIDCATGTVSRH